MKTMILIVTVLALSSAVSVIAQEEVIDQQQTDINYGFWFEITSSDGKSLCFP